ncbi:PA domain-containing protein [Streptomyces sp. NPDC001020]
MRRRGAAAHCAPAGKAWLRTRGAARPVAARAATGGPTADDVPPGTHTVTLITGDVVTTRQSSGTGSPGGTVVVTGPDGKPTDARVMEAGGDLYVYPDAALPYVAQGTLDRRLFDISDLVAAGYDDTHRDRLPLIVSYRDSPAGLWRSAPPPGATRTRDLSSVHGAALAEDRGRAADFWNAVAGAPASRTSGGQAGTAPSFGHGINHIWLDGKARADLADTTAQIGAPQVWAGGDTGEGVDVAVLDTGADTGHPDLKGRIAAARSFVPDQDVEDYMETQTSYDSLWAQPTTERVRHGDFHMAARWRKEEPALSVSAGSTDFTDVLRQAAVTPLPQGQHTLRAVVAGDGTVADYAGVDARGKAVVVRRDSEVGDVEQARAAAAAGARLLLVVNDRPGRQIREYGSDPFTPAPLDVALLSTDEGEKLIEQVRRGRDALTVASVPASPYVYDLMRTWHDEIPADMVVRGGPRNLARVDVTFDSPDPTRGGGEYRFDWPAYSNWGIGTTMREPVNSTRVDWVSTTGENAWGQEAYVDNLLYEVEPKRTYQAGGRYAQDWFKPVERPYLNDNYKPPARIGGRLSADVPGWGGADHVGMSMDYERTRQTLALYQGKTLLGQGTGTVVAGDAPSAGSLPYRLVVENSRDATVSPYSPTTRTEWTFTSKAPAADAQAVLPLIQLDYAIATDGAGRADRNAGLSVTALHLPGAVGAGRVEGLTAEVSYDDGRHWHRLQDPRHGRYTLDAPRGAAFVSLRASARDTEGNTVTQTVARATGLR